MAARKKVKAKPPPWKRLIRRFEIAVHNESWRGGSDPEMWDSIRSEYLAAKRALYAAAKEFENV